MEDTISYSNLEELSYRELQVGAEEDPERFIVDWALTLVESKGNAHDNLSDTDQPKMYIQDPYK